jgi:hypothetical protein
MLRPLLPIAAILLITACSDGQSTPPQPEPTPTITDDCPAPDDICNKAAAFERALLVQKDFDWVVQNYPPQGFVVCNDTTGAFGQPPPAHLCLGAGPDETRHVYQVAEAGSLSASMYADVLRSWVDTPPASVADMYGAPRNRLVTIGCKETPARPACSDGFILVFSKLISRSERSNLIIFIEPRHDSRISTTFIGALPPAHLDAALRGGTIDGFFGPSGRSSTFFPLR